MINHNPCEVNAMDKDLSRIRSFNRFYTQKIGLITNRFLKSEFSLVQARLLFELHHHSPLFARDLVRDLGLNIDFDMVGSIGKRYRRHDEAGTPYCVTFDFESLEDDSVTIRERDTMNQTRMKIDELTPYFREQFLY